MKKIHSLAGSAEGRDVFVLGNGPSLNDVALERLRDRVTIGMNASTLLEEELGWHANYYVLSDARFINNPEKRALATTRIAKSTHRILRADLREHDDPELIESTYYVPVLGKNGFSHSLDRGYYFGCTTMMLALQLAGYVGARRIFLLGADFKYPKDQKRFYPEHTPDPVDPFLGVQLWNVHNARHKLAAQGTELYSCSSNSNLAPYLPYMSPSDALAE